ncbi:hypothetical protein [Nocardia rhamnosiphila]
MDPRLSVITPKWKFYLPVMTYHHDEHEFSGIWQHPDVPALIFADSDFRGPFTYHNGPVGGVGTPIQLIFWGSWWTSGDGAQRQGMVEARTRALLDSHYFDELGQYYIAQKPVWRGSTIVTSPGAPGAVSSRDAMEAVLDLIDDLIDDDVFPDPDDGPRIGFIVLMPPGFATTDFDGAHRHDYDWDFPFDEDNYWAGWCRYYDALVENPETMMQTVAHEIVEMITDPEFDGWHTDIAGDDTGREIADIALSDGGMVWQTAWVNGVNVQGYWSNKHNACIIPIDRDYGARLSGSVTEQSRSLAGSGLFRPELSDSAACSTKLPECCIDDRDYVWGVYFVTEKATVHLSTERYVSPIATWFVNGQQLTGAGSLLLTVDMDRFSGRDVVAATSVQVNVQYVTSNTSLQITAISPGGNFDLTVSCTVRDDSITGNVTTDVIASPHVTVGIVGAVLEVEQAYVDQLSACFTAMLRRYTELHTPSGKPRRGDPINYDPGLDLAVLPAYARVRQYEQAREAVKLIRAANQLLDAESARGFIDNLLAGIPAVAAALKRRSTTETVQDV